MFFQVLGEFFETNISTLSLRGDNRLNSYKMHQISAIILSCLFTMATGLFIQKNIQNMISTNLKPLNKHNNHPKKHFE